MRLVYKKHSTMLEGQEVQVGDKIKTGDGVEVEVTYFREPHKSNSEGKVSVKSPESDWSREYYVSVIRAEWIEREDRIGW